MSANPPSSNTLDDISVSFWDEKTFSQSRKAWTELLDDSDADPLFMSWEWLYHWWQYYKTSDMELTLIALHMDSMLVALAPMYIEKTTRLNGIFPVQRMQFLGKRYRTQAGIRSEYLNFIIRLQSRDTVLEKLIGVVCERCRWDELFLGDIAVEKPQLEETASLLTARRYYPRLEHEGPTYIVDCTGSFSEYLMDLGKNTRLRLYNRRKLFEKMGTAAIENLDSTNTDTFFHTINEWHRQRWKTLIFGETEQQFLRAVFRQGDPRMNLEHSTIMHLDGKPLSTMINASAGGRVYNIQHGFQENFDKRISLGTLHLGYQLESAFNDANIERFDFLEGTGKKSNYKKNLAQEGAYLQSVQWCRSTPLKLIFSVYDKFLRN